jgi:hypothetical protein
VLPDHFSTLKALSSGLIVSILLQCSISVWARITIEKKSKELVGHVEI